MTTVEYPFETIERAVNRKYPLLGSGGYGFVYEVVDAEEPEVCKITRDVVNLGQIERDFNIEFEGYPQFIPLEYDGLVDDEPYILIDGISLPIPKVNNSNPNSAIYRTVREFWALKAIEQSPYNDFVVNIKSAAFFRDTPSQRGVLDALGVYRLAIIEEKFGDGTSLFEWRRTSDARKFSHNDYLDQFFGIARVLDIASSFLVHRDLKPENILVGKNQSGKTQFKLADWGSALIADDTLGGAPISIGTFLFIAPEVVNNSKNATSKSDQFSLALTIADEMFDAYPLYRPKLNDPALDKILQYFGKVSTQQKPSEYNDKGMMKRIQDRARATGLLLTKAQIQRINEVFKRALSYNPDDRYDTNVEFILDLSRAFI